jgi:hypothetical protein
VTGSWACEGAVAGGCDVGGGAVTSGSGVGGDISGEACVQPADSNITSVSAIEIIDSFFILILPYFSLLDTLQLVFQLYIT